MMKMMNPKMMILSCWDIDRVGTWIWLGSLGRDIRSAFGISMKCIDEKEGYQVGFGAILR
jgi:hypothetical protein